MIGWNLLERLFAIGNENPAELARVLEEEDPFKVRDTTVKVHCCTPVEVRGTIRAYPFLGFAGRPLGYPF